MELYDFIITIYCIVDDFCKKEFPCRSLRARGFDPKLSDSEVIMMEVVGEYLGFHNDKEIYKYFQRHWKTLFTTMPDRSNFARQAANLWKVKHALFEHIQRPESDWLEIVDAIPVEVCKFIRAKRSKLFKTTAAYGKWFGRTFFGFRVHIKITLKGMIRSFILAPSNIHEINFLEDLLEDDHDVWALGDKAYRSAPLEAQLWHERKVYLHTSKRRNESRQSPLPKATIRRLTGIRRLVETVNGQLEQQFSIKSTLARDVWHLFNRIIRKILSHTFGVFLNMQLNRDPLKLKSVIA